MLRLGEYNTLTALSDTGTGMQLIDDDNNEAFLPALEVPEHLEKGGKVDVFLYKDSEDKYIGTTHRPDLLLNEFAGLRARAVNDIGAFFEWGPDKDLLVPYRLQAGPITEGNRYVVHMFLDESSDRLVGTTKIGKSLQLDEVELEPGQEVNLLPYKSTDLGFSVVVNNKYNGMLFRNEIFTRVELGVEVKGFVKNVRLDNKVDVTLTKAGYQAMDQNVEKLKEVLLANGGKLDLNDKSDPEAISGRLGMSKKVFKKAVGALYKQQLIEISDEGIKWIGE